MSVWRLQLAIVVVLLGHSWAAAEAALREGFESPEPTWRDAGGDAHYKIMLHERAATGAHSGTTCERVRLSGDNGSYVYLSQEIRPALVIGELSVGVWIRADRPGLQVLLRAVLPRSKDPRTGQPLTTLLRGSGYTQVGAWQRLEVVDLPQLLERQVRVLRTQHGPQVDSHEAYIDRVLLNIYGGPGATEISIDDLEVAGFVARAGVEAVPVGLERPRRAAGEPERLPSPDAVLATETPATAKAGARLSGAGLLVGEKPFFPRLIEYRGEPLPLLKSMGFNGLRLTAEPSPELLLNAAASGLWLVAPPPATRELQGRAARGAAGRFGSEFDPVLIWDLGEGLSTRELEAVKARAKLVRTLDPRARPMICDPDSDLRSYSRPPIDMLWIERLPLGTSLGPAEYSSWLRERPQLARPGTPIWTVIQTQPSPRLLEQAAAISGSPQANLGWQDEQVRLLTFAALASGVRGLGFQSQAALAGADVGSRRRAALLELLNLELELIEPWCASGSFVTTASGTDPESAAAVMQTDRARLVLPLSAAPFNQFALRLPAGGIASYVVPGVPESNDAYELTPVGLRPLAHKRVAGGIRVVLPEGERGALVVLTQDPTVISNLSKRVTRVRKRAAELQCELAALHLRRVDQVEPRLAAKGQAAPQNQAWLDAARAALRQADTQLRANDLPNAFAQARHAGQLLYQVERASWDKTVQPIAAPLSTPLGLSYELLPEYWQFVAEAGSARRSANLLAAGEFEDLRFLLQSGWRHFQHPQPGIVTDVQLAAEPAHGGKLSLHLHVAAAKADQPPALVETAPLWVTTAPVQVEAGQVVCIRGWVNVPKAPAGSVDGLLLLDSFGGEPLAERISQTSGWREVTLYRAAPRSGPLVVTFALTGLGDAYLDDFAIYSIDRPRAVPLEQARQPLAPATAQPPARR